MKKNLLWTLIISSVLLLSMNIQAIGSPPKDCYNNCQIVRPTTFSAWHAAFGCETGYKYNWKIVSRSGIYHGGIQFDHWTWWRFGGLEFAYDADQATPSQQILVASRVTYDAWPHCPEPPRIR